MQLLSLLDKYKTAVFQKDLAAFASIFDEKVRVFDMWLLWSYEGLDSWMRMAAGWFAGLGSDKDVVTFDDIQIQETGDMGIITAVARFTAVSEAGEDLRYLENRLTWVAKRDSSGWKIIHQHTSSPIDFDTMQVVLQR